MKFFTTIGHFFKSLFGNVGDEVQIILHGISSYVNLSQPIVAEIAGIAASVQNPPALVKDLSSWLAKYQVAETAVSGFVTQATGMTTADILHLAATTALSALVPQGALLSDLNLAVELAYAIFKRTAPAPAAVAPVPAPVTTAAAA